MRWMMAFALAAACGGSHADPSVDAPGNGDAPHSDSPAGSDAASDGTQLLGNACPTTVTEVKRITDADSAYPYVNEKRLVADLDHDGLQDIVLIEGQSDSQNQVLDLRLRVFMRTNASDFGAAVQSDLVFPYYGATGYRFGDFNGDGRLDILLSYEDSQSFSRTSYFYVATQGADHTFTLGSSINISACQSSSDEREFAVAVADVDRDGYDDVLVTVSYNGLGAAPAGLSLLKGSASGLGFATCARSATTNNAGYPLDMVTAERFRTADFDGDGHVDLLGLYYNHITLFHSSGASQFTEAATTPTYDEYAHLAIDHVAGRTDDGLIATTSMDTTMTSLVNRYSIDASGVAAGVPLGMLDQDGGGFDILRGYGVADFNGDGRTDVIEVGNHGYSNNYPDPVSFGMACDRGAIWEVSTGTFPNGIYDAQPIDFAGKTDVLVHEGNSYDLVIYQLQ